ncbi:MAG: S41 family peptidase [Bacteroidaceae bacterium]|nr:S41 family peptidase [Bacteroidaceae bacterium]
MPLKRSNRFVPLYVSLGILLGIIIGSFYANLYSRKSLSIMNSSGNKLYDLLYTIDDQYVDTVNIDELVESALPDILKGLDPHSVYMNPDQVEQSMAELNGYFSGIGVQFLQYRDSVMITNIIQGGPSEKLNLKPGDRIISADGVSLVGKDVTTDFIMKKLKGQIDTQVRLSIVRPGESSPFDVVVVRGNVPVRTVSSHYMITPETGYISINSFGESTYPEFLAALANLNQYDFQSLVIDLRGNLGGYMSAAVSIANEFLPKGKLIVYTEGRKSPREEYKSDGRGAYQDLPLVILIDETSASASEILAGAIQDNDRGTIIGRRSFGKGLVQVPVEFSDGSVVRLTKARYYTSSGRCLQKPYKAGNGENYEDDLINRLNHGEYYSMDSIKTNGEKYHTEGGRIVYGGGGVIPDHFVGIDTTDITSYYKDLYMSGLINKFAIAFVDNNRSKLTSFDDVESFKKYLDRQNVIDQLANYAEKNGIRRRNLMIQRSYHLLRRMSYQYIISNTFDNSRAIEYLNEMDPVVAKALLIIDAGETFPIKAEHAAQ